MAKPKANRKLRENRRHRYLAYAAKIECFLVAILANYFAIFSHSLPAFFLYLIHFLYESGTIKKINRSRFFFFKFMIMHVVNNKF